MRRQRESGTAILITMIVVVALLGGGAVLVGMQLSSTRSTEIARSNMSALYCAEAGLNAARPIIANNYPWDASLCNPPAPIGTGTCNISTPAGLLAAEPLFLAHPTNLDHDLDADTVRDYVITIKDNDDEAANGLANDLSKDNDLAVWVISTCTKFPENQKQVSELVRFNITGGCNCAQVPPPPCCN